MLSEDDTAHSKRKKHDEFFAKWGFSDYEISDLDQAIAMFILPRLAYQVYHNLPGSARGQSPARVGKMPVLLWQSERHTQCQTRKIPDGR